MSNSVLRRFFRSIFRKEPSFGTSEILDQLEGHFGLTADDPTTCMAVIQLRIADLYQERLDASKDAELQRDRRLAALIDRLEHWTPPEAHRPGRRSREQSSHAARIGDEPQRATIYARNRPSPLWEYFLYAVGWPDYRYDDLPRRVALWDLLITITMICIGGLAGAAWAAHQLR